MKERMAKKMTYLGAGVGAMLFVVFGLLPGSFLGGVAGLSVAGSLLGTPLTSGLLARVIVGAAMVLGVMLAGVIMVAGTSIAGWLLGTAWDRTAGTEAEAAHVKA